MAYIKIGKSAKPRNRIESIEGKESTRNVLSTRKNANEENIHNDKYDCEIIIST